MLPRLFPAKGGAVEEDPDSSISYPVGCIGNSAAGPVVNCIREMRQQRATDLLRRFCARTVRDGNGAHVH